MPAYKVSKAADSMAIAADTSLDVDVIAVLAERIRPIEEARTVSPDSISAPDIIGKTQYLLIKKIGRKKKNKLLATVPMITMFPPSTDTADGEEAIPADERPKDMNEEQAPTEETAPQEQSDQPAEAPQEQPQAQPEKKKEEDTNPF